MRRIVLVLFMVLALSGVAFAQVTVSGPETYGPVSPITGANLQQGQGQSLTSTISPVISPDINVKSNVDIDNTNKNTNINTNKNTNINRNIGINKQSQGQSQEQKQFQGQNNDQVIAPVQTNNQEITFEAPNLSKQRVVVGAAPNVASPGELNFISPNERDVQTYLPKFGCDTIKPLVISDCIVDVIWQSNDIKFKDLYKTVLKGLRSDGVQKLSAKAVRYQIREAASTKTWTTGGSLGGSSVGPTGQWATGGSAGILPQIGRSKSSNLYTVIFVQVQDFKLVGSN